MEALRFLQDSLGARGVRAGRTSRSVSKRGAHAGDEGGAHISERKQAECLCIRVSLPESLSRMATGSHFAHFFSRVTCGGDGIAQRPFAPVES